MATSTSLRKAIRQVPALRVLPEQDLEQVMARLLCKQYAPGDRLWRAGSPLDFIGIIQQGEIAVEYARDGSGKHSAALTAGDFVQPRDVGAGSTRAAVSARALTDVKLYVVRLEELADLRSKRLSVPRARDARPRQRVRRLPRTTLWAVCVAVLIVLLAWRDVSRTLSGILTLRSGESLASADPQQALRLVRYAESLAPDSALAHNQEGIIWYQRADTGRAAAAFERAVEADEQSGPALNNLAVTYFSTGERAESAVLAQNAVQAAPNAAAARYNLGLIWMDQGDLAGALREFRQASLIEPDWAGPYLQQSAVYLVTGDDAEAEKAARRAVHLNSALPAAHLNLAIALRAQGKHQAALASVERALYLSPEDTTARFYHALILHDLGDPEGALAVLEPLLEQAEDAHQRSRIAAEIEFVQRSLYKPPDKTQQEKGG